MTQALWVFLLTIQALASCHRMSPRTAHTAQSSDPKEAHHLQSCTAPITADSVHNIVRDYKC